MGLKICTVHDKNWFVPINERSLCSILRFEIAMEKQASCAVGEYLECHKLCYCRKSGVKRISDFDEHEQKLIWWRS